MHSILEVGYKNELCNKAGGPIVTIYTSYDVFLRNELPFGGLDDCNCVKFLVAFILFNRD